MPESKQEAMVAAFGAASLGAPFLWEPALFRKGKAVREPADLAWLCRGTLFLMNMKAGSGPADRLHNGNMKQLRGWLRMWANGVRLRGSNAWRSFDLGPGDVDQIVLVSIAETDDARCAVSLAQPASGFDERSLLLEAHLTPGVLIWLARRAGSACDLTDLLLYLASSPDPLDEAHLLTHLDDMWLAGRERALQRCDRERDQELDDVTMRTIQGTARLARFAEAPSEAIAEALAGINGPGRDGTAIFNDLDFESTYLLVYSAADVTNAVRYPKENAYWTGFSARKYSVDSRHFVVAATSAWARPETVSFGTASTFEAVTRMGQENPGQPVIMMSSLVTGPSAREVSGFLSVFGPTSQRTTSETLRAAAELVRERDRPTGEQIRRAGSPSDDAWPRRGGRHTRALR